MLSSSALEMFSLAQMGQGQGEGGVNYKWNRQ